MVGLVDLDPKRSVAYRLRSVNLLSGRVGRSVPEASHQRGNQDNHSISSRGLRTDPRVD